MPSYCCVINCRNSRKYDKVTFHRIPAIVNYPHKPWLNELSKLRREKWLAAIRRPDLYGPRAKNAAVCSQHFISAPARLENYLSPDWVPSVNMGYKKNSGTKIRRKKAKLECPSAEKEEVQLISEVGKDYTVEIIKEDEDTDTAEECFDENIECTQCSKESFWAQDDTTKPYSYTVTKLNKESNTKSVWTIKNEQGDFKETSEQSNYTVIKLKEKESTLAVKNEPHDFNEIFVKTEEIDHSSCVDEEENYGQDMYISENEEEFLENYNDNRFEFIKHEMYDHMPADQEVSLVLGLP